MHARVRRLQAIDREYRPTSIARIVQRRAAIQNCCLCPVQQNFCVDPPVIRGENVDHTTGSAHPERGSGLEVIVTEPPEHLQKARDPESGLALIRP